jgi:EAL domain-containing protein (putative c-di-GMP-specific phosphodiesterase class I)
MRVVAEGVENDAAFAWLKDRNTDYVQGFISPPLPTDEFIT